MRYALLLLIWASACGGGSQAISCDYRPDSASQNVCVEWTQYTATYHDDLVAGCLSPAVWTERACARVGALGGCKTTTESSIAVKWFFVDPARQIATAADVMKECTSTGSTFVEP